METRGLCVRDGSRYLFAALSIAGLIGCGDVPAEDLEATTAALYSGVGHCPPFDDDSVCLCTDANLGGTCQAYSINFGLMVNPAAFAPFPNDKLSSVAAGANVGIVNYMDDQYYFCDGACNSFETRYFGNQHPGTTPTAQNLDTGIFSGDNDKMSSFRIVRPSDFNNCLFGTPPAGTIAIYTDANYSNDCVILGVGDYPNPLWAPGSNGTKGNFGMHNDWMSSVKLTPGRTVKLWHDAATLVNGHVTFAGASLTLTSDTPDLATYGFNDVVSAVQIY